MIVLEEGMWGVTFPFLISTVIVKIVLIILIKVKNGIGIYVNIW